MLETNPSMETWSNSAIARAGALHLADLVRKSGQFVYAYQLGGEEIAGYNLLRHSGSIWSMADVAGSLSGLESVGRAAQRALAWLLEKRAQSLGKGLCLVGKGQTTKLGGAALAALACLEVNSIQPNAKLVRAARAFGTFILMMRLPNGDFLHKIDIESKKVLPFRSDYYTGEALFALAKLYTQTRDTRWRDAALESIQKLSKIDYGVIEQSHWMLYALDEVGRAVDKDLCSDYGKRIVQHILDYPDYRDRDQSTPTACRSEGMIAFVRLTTKSTDPEICQVRDRALIAIKENLELQRSFFHPSGAFVRGGGRDDVRIDFVQHNISSFLHYDEVASVVGSNNFN